MLGLGLPSARQLNMAVSGWTTVRLAGDITMEGGARYRERDKRERERESEGRREGGRERERERGREEGRKREMHIEAPLYTFAYV